MKKKIFVLISSCLCFMLILSGCAGILLSGGPNASDTVYGNGGMAVRKGSYLYFANSFKSYQTVDVNDNKYGTEDLAGIYRVKLNEQGLVDTDEDGMPVGAELLVNQIAGYENSDLYIFGDYIYYTTPMTRNSSSGDTVFGLYSFERVKLDGSNHTTLHYTTEYASTFEFKFYQINNTVYILTYDGNEIRSIAVDLSGRKVYNRKLATAVSSVAFPSGIIHDELATDFSKYVYYTKAPTQDDQGYTDGILVLKTKIDGSSDETIIRYGTSTEGYDLKEVKNNRLYFEDAEGYIRSAEEKTGSSANIILNAKYYSDSTTSKITDYYILDDQNFTDIGIVALYNNASIIHYTSSQNYTVITNLSSAPNSETSMNILSVNGANVFYQYANTGSVYSQSIYQTASKRITVIESINLTLSETTETTDTSKIYFDCDGSYIFFYDTAENSNSLYYYLHMIKIGTKNEAGEDYSQFIGVLDADDVLEEEEEE